MPRLNPSSIIGLMVGLLLMAYTLPTAISELANTTIQGNTAAAALWGLLPILAIVAVIAWLLR